MLNLYMPQNSRKYKKGKKRIRYKPRQYNYRGKSYQNNANKIELVRPMTLKSTSVIKKFVYYNTAEVLNNLDTSGNQNAQFFSMLLNSPWLFSSDQFARQHSNSWNWNKPFLAHSPGDPSNAGTYLPGMFESLESIGNQYQNHIIVGTKTTITASPIFHEANQSSGAQTALFANIQTQGSNLTPATTIDDLYNLPYTQLKKVVGAQSNNGDLNGSTKGAVIVIKYSPKRMNNLKDIRDNREFVAQVDVGGANGRHPADVDRITFGIVNVASNPQTPRKCSPILLQVKHEATVLMTEPLNNGNVTVAKSAGAGATYSRVDPLSLSI